MTSRSRFNPFSVLIDVQVMVFVYEERNRFAGLAHRHLKQPLRRSDWIGSFISGFLEMSRNWAVIRAGSVTRCFATERLRATMIFLSALIWS